jgi:hypothetical protein
MKAQIQPSFSRVHPPLVRSPAPYPGSQMFGQQTHSTSKRQGIDQLALLINTLFSWQGKLIRHLEKKVAGQAQFEQPITSKLKNTIENFALRDQGDIITEDWDVHKIWILLKLGNYPIPRSAGIQKISTIRLPDWRNSGCLWNFFPICQASIL